MRRAITWTMIAAAACGGPLPSRPFKGNAPWSGPDAVLVRMPISGGIARAYRWSTDSVLWVSTQPVPALTRLLAFDDEAGALTFIDKRGAPGRLELRLGSATPASTVPLSALASADGWAVYGITPKREVQRLTPSGNWTYTSALVARQLLPQPDGSLVLLSDIGDRSHLRRLYPPEARVTDTASVPRAGRAITTALGDRIYFTTDSGLAGVRVRDLARLKTIRLSSPAVDAVPTPSGDRVYVALAGERRVQVIDRYEEKVVQSIDAGAPLASLRMDPDGRYLLAERDSQDSVVVISVADAQVVRVLATKWRGDVPLVGPDGGVLVLDSMAALDVDPVTGKVRRTYAGGASDLWALVRWNGFRPRAKGLDVPVSFDADSDTTAVVPDSASAAGRAVAPPPVAITPAPPAASNNPSQVPPPPVRPPAQDEGKSGQWTLSFAALLDEARARTMALSIHVDGKQVHVVKGARDGTAIWRVVAGPYASRAEADRAGRSTGLPYWVYEGNP